MLLTDQGHPFGTVVQNWTFLEALFSENIEEDLDLHAYKVQFIQELKPNDHTKGKERAKNGYGTSGYGFFEQNHLGQ